jgi:hypothetical protein
LPETANHRVKRLALVGLLIFILAVMAAPFGLMSAAFVSDEESLDILNRP